jgi:hypothetical protein
MNLRLKEMEFEICGNHETKTGHAEEAWGITLYITKKASKYPLTAYTY